MQGYIEPLLWVRLRNCDTLNWGGQRWAASKYTQDDFNIVHKGLKDMASGLKLQYYIHSLDICYFFLCLHIFLAVIFPLQLLDKETD